MLCDLSTPTPPLPPEVTDFGVQIRTTQARWGPHDLQGRSLHGGRSRRNDFCCMRSDVAHRCASDKQPKRERASGHNPQPRRSMWSPPSAPITSLQAGTSRKHAVAHYVGIILFSGTSPSLWLFIRTSNHV